MNIETLFNEASKELKRHKIKSSILDSEILISETIKKSREFIILNSKKKVEKMVDSTYFRKKRLKRWLIRLTLSTAASMWS